MAMLNNQRVLYILSYQKLWDDLKPIIGLQCAGQILLCKPLQVSRVVGKLPSSCDKFHFFLVKSHVLFWKSPILSWWNLQLFPQKHRISSPCLQLQSNIWWNLHFSCLNYHVWVVKWPFFFVKPIIFWANSPPNHRSRHRRGLHFPQQLSPGVSTFIDQVVEGLALHLRFKELDDYLSHRIHVCYIC